MACARMERAASRGRPSAPLGQPRPWTLRSRQGRSPGSRVAMAVIPSRWLAPVALFDRHSPFTVAGAAPALIALQAIAPASLLASGPRRSEGTLIRPIGPAGTPVSILARATWPLCALREPNSPLVHSSCHAQGLALPSRPTAGSFTSSRLCGRAARRVLLQLPVNTAKKCRFHAPRGPDAISRVA